MRKTQGRMPVLNRVLALVLAFVMVAGYFPTNSGWKASAAEPGQITTVADPETLTRPTDIYGQNTLNAGKVTVGKSVATHNETVKLGTNDKFSFTAAENNFTVTISQYAQVMGLSSESSVPVDVVFVLDTSRSMQGDRVTTMVTAANNAIATLMAANENNRVAVVAFSGTGGQGTSNGQAASVLSYLNHYEGDAATNHIQWVNSNGGTNGTRNYIQGRGTNAGRRLGTSSGTNIHAGIALGGKLLADVPAADTKVNGVTRMPFLVVLSDGVPTYAASGTWYSPSQTVQLGGGVDTYSRAGLGFLPALTAAYYKGLITENYYGTNADENNRCYIYTMGLGLSSGSLAEATVDPSNATGTYANTFATYWNSYKTGNSFSVNTYGDQNYTITEASIDATEQYVSTYKYNDAYYTAAEAEDLEDAFTSIVTEISKKAISSPTHITTSGENFSGYVHFSDPIGEYMEVKDMKGLVIGDYFYQGASFAQLLESYGSGSTAQNQFDAMLRSVLDERMKLSGSTMDEAAFIQNALQSENQAYYKSATDFDNSIVWWGSDYVSGNGEQLQVLANADDDSIAYIEAQAAAGKIPKDAKYVCRSYFFYGTAGGTNPTPNHEMMYFMVRVQRALEAPYQQTVVISCPASLLSVEKVLITEEADGTYSASITDASPARVVYEVGLRHDINAQNVDQIVDSTYKSETVNGTGSVNYSNGTYSFFTNDWDRTQSQGSHHRAMTEATFEAAADNSFYTYQQDTLLLDASGNPATYNSATGGTFYYARTYYDWSNATLKDGVYTGVAEKTELIKVQIDAGTNLTQKDGKWYIPAGVYAASTLQTTGDDVIKGDDPTTESIEKNNVTGTSEIVSHAHRTNSATDNHYTVKLGNNGMLTLVSDPPKSVDVTHNGITLEDQDGKTVMVGDILTYKIKVVNNEGAAAAAVVTDKIPTGTELVSGSISHGGQENSGTITWNLNLAKDETVTVSFQVKVLPDALAGEQNVQNITNTGTIRIGNNPAYTTNTTTNPPEGKKVVVDAEDAVDGVQVGDILTYRIRYYNDTDAVATITVTDIVPKGTTFISAEHGGQQISEGADEGRVVWVIENVAPGKSGVVSFDVMVDASAKQSENATQPGEGEIAITNNATIQIGPNGPTQSTNTTETKVKTGNVAVKKVVTNTDKQNRSFKVRLTESTGKLDGTYLLSGSTAVQSVRFTAGVSEELEIAHGQTLTVHGLPEGTVIYVQELGLADMPGWSAVYEDNDGGKDPQRVIVIADDPQTPEEEIRQFTITNTYSVSPAAFRLKGSKSFSGINFPAGRFTFKAQLADANGAVKTGNDALSVTAIIDHTGGEKTNVEFQFSGRTFTAEETRYYLIDEAAVTIPGVTTSTRQYLLEVAVKDVNAQLTVTARIRSRENANASWGNWSSFDWQEESVSFTNTYAPRQTSVSISGEKTLENRYLDPHEFSFQLLQGTDVIATTTNTAGGSGSSLFKFADITITSEEMGGEAEKVFTYYVREVQSGPANVTFDGSIYEVKITIEDVDGELKETGRTVTKYTPKDGGGYDNAPADKIAFTNTFNIQDTKIALSGIKNLIGEAAAALDAEDFTFVIYEADSTYKADTSKIAAGAGNEADDSNQPGLMGAIKFSDISYTAAMLSDVQAVEGVKTKDFYYVAKEVIPGTDEPSFDPNMKYDQTQYLIKVQVQLTVATGEMTAKVVEVSTRTGDNGAAGNPAAVGADSYDALNFTNIKNPATVSYKPEGKKTITGDKAAPGLRFSFRVLSLGEKQGQQITWYAAADRKVEATGISAGDAVANDTIIFTALTYSAADVGKTYYYLIEEVSAAIGNMVTYDTAQYVLEVTVGRDADNALTQTHTYYKVVAGQDAANQANWKAQDESGVTYGDAAFSNNFDAYAILDITATKKLTGNRNLEINEFDFRLQLLDENGDPVPGMIVDGVNTGAVSDNSNLIRFGTLIFTDEQMRPEFLLKEESGEDGSKVITYQYRVLVTEIEPAAARIPGVDYSDEQYILTIQWVVTQPANATDPSGYRYADPAVVAYHKLDSQGNEVPVTKDDFVFTNHYEPTSVSVTFTAKKTLSGRPLNAGEFTFQLFRGDTLVETATNAADGLVKFTRIYPSGISADFFTEDSDNDGNKEATFTYTLKEVQTNKGGVDYSNAEYTIDVVIEHNTDTAALSVMSVTYKDKDGNVIADGEDAGDAVDEGEIVFANTYSADDTAYTPVANKTLLGAENAELALNDRTFSFQVYELDANGERIVVSGTGEQTVYKVVSTGTSDEFGQIIFAPITYTHNATGEALHSHYYEIKEMASTDSTITVDPTKYYLKVTIKDDLNGNLSIDSVGYYTSFADAKAGTNPVTEPVRFVNHYGPGYVNINLELDKVVQLVNTNVYDMQDGQFDFTVRMTDGTYVTSGTNDANGRITFGSITVTQPGDYVYAITEDVPSDADVKGIAIDTKTIYAHVDVETDGYGNFSYTVSYRDSAQWMQGNEIEGKFTNTYTANPVNFNIVAHKHLSGKHLADKEFRFKLYSVDAAGNETEIASVENNAAGEVVFQMGYDQVGTYVYHLKETGKGSGAVDGSYGFDNHYYKITVVVADDTEGNLFIQSAEKVRLENTEAYSLRASALTKAAAMDFYNTFTPDPLEIDLTAVIGGTKTVVDPEGNIRDDLAEGFRFEVRDISNALVSEGVSRKDDATGKVIIDLATFKFTEAGEYHYWIYETDAADPYTKDDAIYEVHILVHKNLTTGELYINPDEVMTFTYGDIGNRTDGEDAVDFVNEYNPDPVTVTITADKILTGRELKDGEFTFHLVEETGGNRIIRAEATNDANGKITFTLTYVTDGAHTYSIHEHAPTDAHKAGGVTYDTKSYGTINVTVKEENGALVVTQGNSIASGVTITNKYTAKPVTAVVEANKQLTGGLNLKADAFTFQLKDENGDVVATAKNDAGGKIRFEVPFEHKDLEGVVSKTFAYTIHEVKGEIPGVVYDESEYKVFITVTDDLNGNLNYSTAYETGTVPTFTNVYKADDAPVIIQATKVLTGKNLAGEDFAFQLLDEAGNVVETAKNDADGNIRFSFTLAEAGTYEYTIVEVAHADHHYSHDDRTYKVTVTVNDNGEGKLVAEDPVYEKTPIFENTYTPDGIQVTVEASKQFTGGKRLQADAFTFQLLDAENKEVATAKNTADGKISFLLDIEAEGTYTYTMVEKTGTDAHITYDTNSYTVTVKVTNVDGVLTPVVTYSTENGKAPVFKNTWKPDKISITLTGTKTLTGRDMKAGEFKFQVHDSTGTLVATGTNNAKGEITFTPVGIVVKGTYLLTVSEVAGNADHVTYDKAVFQVKVVVENVDGVLVPTVTYMDGDIAFENSYDEPNNPETGDNSPIYWLIGLLAISGLAIVLLIIFRPKKGGKYAKK